MRKVLAVLVVMLAAWVAVGTSWAADTPATPQIPGEHSTIVTSDGSIRDDELADYIAAQLAGKSVSDVKVFFQGCYGGGFLDDIERALGPTGIPWVGGSAANANEPAWTGDGADGSGSFWTDALGDSMGTTGTVAGDIGAANAADAAAPGNPMALGDPEHPQQASGNGGSGITWGSQAQVVVFAGDPNMTSIENDVSNMEDNFSDQYHGDEDSTIYSSATGSRSTQDLKDMIRDAANGLSGGQLVLYFADHGDTEFDVDEFWADLTGGNIIADPVSGWSTDIDPIELHEGWVIGLDWMNEKPDEVPEPYFDIVPTTELFGDEWTLLLNGVEIGLPGVILPGVGAHVPVPWHVIQAGPNDIQLLPNFPGTGPLLELENLELASGPIAQRVRVIPEPGSLALWLFGFAQLARRKRR